MNLLNKLIVAIFLY